MNKTFFVIILFFYSLSFIYSLESVEIYLINYNYVKSHSYNEEMVRNYPDICVRLFDRNEINNLKDIINNCEIYSLNPQEKDYAELVIDFFTKKNIEDREERFNTMIEKWHFQEYEEVDTYIFNKFYFYKKGEDIYYKTPISLLDKYIN